MGVSSCNRTHQYALVAYLNCHAWASKELIEKIRSKKALWSLKLLWKRNPSWKVSESFGMHATSCLKGSQHDDMLQTLKRNARKLSEMTLAKFSPLHYMLLKLLRIYLTFISFHKEECQNRAKPYMLNPKVKLENYVPLSWARGAFRTWGGMQEASYCNNIECKIK